MVNETQEGGRNIWKEYEQNIVKHASTIANAKHSLDVYALESNGIVGKHHDARLALEKKITKTKAKIYSTFQLIAAENNSDIVWEKQMMTDDARSDAFSVDEVMCSKCNLDSEEGNDILFCDRKGCYRYLLI